MSDILAFGLTAARRERAVLKSRNYDAGTYPARPYIEGSDQHRGWFQSSLFPSARSIMSPLKSASQSMFHAHYKGEKIQIQRRPFIASQPVRERNPPPVGHDETTRGT